MLYVVTFCPLERFLGGMILCWNILSCGTIFKWNDFPVTVFDGMYFGGMICPATVRSGWEWSVVVENG